MNITYFGHFFHEKEKETNKNFDPESWRSRAVDAGDKKRIGQKNWRHLTTVCVWPCGPT